MNCSYCQRPLPEGNDTVDDMPNVFIYGKQHQPMLALYAECIQEVRRGLVLGEKLVTN